MHPNIVQPYLNTMYTITQYYFEYASDAVWSGVKDDGVAVTSILGNLFQFDLVICHIEE